MTDTTIIAGGVTGLLASLGAFVALLLRAHRRNANGAAPTGEMVTLLRLQHDTLEKLCDLHQQVITLLERQGEREARYFARGEKTMDYLEERRIREELAERKGRRG